MLQVWPVADLDRPEKTDKMVLWSHSDPTAVARACLLGVTVEKDWQKGHEIFYIVSPKNVHYKTVRSSLLCRLPVAREAR